MESVVVGFGSNLGARAAWIDVAHAMLSAQPGLEVVRRSPLYETPPLGPPQPDYLNAAALLRYAGSMESLLSATQHVETQLLRTRDVRWGARTLDLDLLAAARGPYQSARLVLPHPGLFERAFALAPLRDLAPPWPIVGAPTAHPAAFPAQRSHPVRVRRCASQLLIASDDLAEWLSALVAGMVEIACLCTNPSLEPLPAARSAMAFQLPAGSLAQLADTLWQRVSGLYEAGFAVRCGVVAELDASAARGLLLGEHTARRVQLPGVRAQLTHGGEIDAGRYVAQLSLA